VKSHSIRCAALAAILLAACRSSGSDTTSASSSTHWPEQPEGPLYARDGHVVAPAGGASASEPAHDVTPRDGSRVYLLELYQKTVEEKEGLMREVQTLQAAAAHDVETQSALGQERDTARARVTELEQKLQLAQADNADLAARLVTAQVRRLEAEKLLLEARIEAAKRDPSTTAEATSVRESAAHVPPANAVRLGGREGQRK
jgi:hypothetical protein